MREAPVGTNGGAHRRSQPCRFCGRGASATDHRIPGPYGPVCAGCLETGLQLVRDGQPRPGPVGAELVRVRSVDDAACEFCGRRQRHSFLGFRRPLARMSCPQVGAVICVDCLDHGGDLINQALRR